MTARIGKAKITITDGRARVAPAKGYTTKQRHLKAARLERAWRSKSASGVRVPPRGET